MPLNSHHFEDMYKKLGINLDTLGCVMLDLEPLSDSLNPTSEMGIELYASKNKDRSWIDGWVCGKVPHITLLYGLLESAQNQNEGIEMVLSGWELGTIEIENIGYFDSPYSDEPYYCIVAHIKKTQELLEGHHRLEFLPHINTFTSYKPHMTICYIDKKCGGEKRDMYIEWLKDKLVNKPLKVKSLNLGD